MYVHIFNKYKNYTHINVFALLRKQQQQKKYSEYFQNYNIHEYFIKNVYNVIISTVVSVVITSHNKQ